MSLNNACKKHKINENFDYETGENIDWLELMLTRAYKKNHKDIVKCIRGSGKIDIQIQLESASRYGDLEYISKYVNNTHVAWLMQ